MKTNAIDMLKADHKVVKALLAELMDTTTRATKKRMELLLKIQQELAVHTQIEEQIFYPAFKDAGGAEFRALNFEALEEHRAVEELILPDLFKTDPATDKFSGRAKVLKELVEHHADEEEKEMFKMAKKAMTTEQLKQLGEQMSQLKQELQERAAA